MNSRCVHIGLEPRLVMTGTSTILRREVIAVVEVNMKLFGDFGVILVWPVCSESSPRYSLIIEGFAPFQARILTRWPPRSARD